LRRDLGVWLGLIQEAIRNIFDEPCVQGIDLFENLCYVVVRSRYGAGYAGKSVSVGSPDDPASFYFMQAYATWSVLCVLSIKDFTSISP